MRPQRHEQMATGRVLLEKSWYDADEMDEWLADDTVQRFAVDYNGIVGDDWKPGDEFVTYDDHCRARAADRERIAELERELAEYESLFELQSKRLDEATAAWRAAHPGHDDMLPDLGRLLEWLMSERTEARTERDTAVAACRERDEEIARLREQRDYLAQSVAHYEGFFGTKEDDDEHTRQD